MTVLEHSMQHDLPIENSYSEPRREIIWIICSSQTVRYYCEMNLYYVIFKFTTSIAVNSMFKGKDFNLGEVNEVIF